MPRAFFLIVALIFLLLLRTLRVVQSQKPAIISNKRKDHDRRMPITLVHILEGVSDANNPSSDTRCRFGVLAIGLYYYEAIYTRFNRKRGEQSESDAGTANVICRPRRSRRSCRRDRSLRTTCSCS